MTCECIFSNCQVWVKAPNTKSRVCTLHACACVHAHIYVGISCKDGAEPTWPKCFWHLEHKGGSSRWKMMSSSLCWLPCSFSSEHEPASSSALDVSSWTFRFRRTNWTTWINGCPLRQCSRGKVCPSSSTAACILSLTHSHKLPCGWTSLDLHDSMLLEQASELLWFHAGILLWPCCTDIY